MKWKSRGGGETIDAERNRFVRDGPNDNLNRANTKVSSPYESYYDVSKKSTMIG